MPDPVKLATARELVDAGAVRQAVLIGQRGGYAIVLRVGMADRALALKDGTPRLFAQLDGAVRVLRQLGVARFEVDATGYAPGDLIRRRPDRAEALRRQAEVVAHDRWFRAQVEAAVAKDAAGESRFHEHDAVFAQLREHAQRLAG